MCKVHYSANMDRYRYIRKRLLKIESMSVRDGIHMVYFGMANNNSYPVIRLCVPGFAPKTMVVARAVYMLRTKDFDMLLGLKSEWHVSHLCHRRDCILQDHLILEPGFVNKDRRTCNSEGRCFHNHNGYPDCVF